MMESHDGDGDCRDDRSHSSNVSRPQNVSVDDLFGGNELDVGSQHFGDSDVGSQLYGGSYGASQSYAGSQIADSYQSLAFKTGDFGHKESGTSTMGSHLTSHLGSRLDSQSQFRARHGKGGSMTSATGAPPSSAAGGMRDGVGSSVSGSGVHAFAVRGHIGSNMQLGSRVPASNVYSFAAGANGMLSSNVPGSSKMVPSSNMVPGSNVHSFAAGSNEFRGDHILHQHLGDVCKSQIGNMDFRANLKVNQRVGQEADQEIGQEADQKPAQEVHEYPRSDRRSGLSSDMPSDVVSSEYHPFSIVSGTSQSSSDGETHSSDHSGSKSHSVPAGPRSSNVNSITVSHSQRRSLRNSRRSQTVEERKEHLQSGMVELDGAVLYEKPYSSPGQYSDRSASRNPHPRSFTSPISQRSSTGRSKSPLMGWRSAGDHGPVDGHREFMGASHLEDSVDVENDPDTTMRPPVLNSKRFDHYSKGFETHDSELEKTIKSHDYKLRIVFWTFLPIVVVIIAMIVVRVIYAIKIERLDEVVFNKKSAGMQPNVVGSGVDHSADVDQSVQPVGGSHTRGESSEGGFDGKKVGGGLGGEVNNAGRDGSKDRVVGTNSLKEKEPLEVKVKRLERELEKKQRERRERSRTIAAQSKAISEHDKLLEEVSRKLELSSKLSPMRFDSDNSIETKLSGQREERVDNVAQNNVKQNNNASKFGKFVSDSAVAFLAGVVSGTVSGGVVSYLGNEKFEKQFVDSLDSKFKSLETQIGSEIDTQFDSNLSAVEAGIVLLRTKTIAEVEASKDKLTSEFSTKLLVDSQSKTEAAAKAGLLNLKNQIAEFEQKIADTENSLDTKLKSFEIEIDNGIVAQFDSKLERKVSDAVEVEIVSLRKKIVAEMEVSNQEKLSTKLKLEATAELGDRQSKTEATEKNGLWVLESQIADLKYLISQVPSVRKHFLKEADEVHVTDGKVYYDDKETTDYVGSHFTKSTVESSTGSATEASKNNSLIYLGSMLHGLFHGEGTLVHGEGTGKEFLAWQIGSWTWGKLDGWGLEIFEKESRPDGENEGPEVYIGNFKRGLRHGSGVNISLTPTDGATWKGQNEWKDGKVVQRDIGQAKALKDPDLFPFQPQRYEICKKNYKNLCFENGSEVSGDGLFIGLRSENHFYVQGVQVQNDGLIKMFSRVNDKEGDSECSVSPEMTRAVFIPGMMHYYSKAAYGAESDEIANWSNAPGTNIGDWRTKKRNGKGIVWTDGGVYIGDWKDNKMHGKGTMKYVNGDEYEGEWNDDKRHGRGTFTCKVWLSALLRIVEPSIIRHSASRTDGPIGWGQGGHVPLEDGQQWQKYEGDWKHDDRDGKGTMKWVTREGESVYEEEYEGEWKDNKMHGEGTMRYENGDTYTGTWKDSEEDGKGTWQLVDGDIYVGDFENGEIKGEGTYTYKNGDVYTGSWENDEKNGEGTCTYENGDVYTGSWENDEKNGKGTMWYSNGDKYEGDWKDDERSGQGTLTKKDGEVREGKWPDDEWVGAT